jgi:hypothetical protein
LGNFVIAPIARRFIELRDAFAYREQHFQQTKRMPFNPRHKLKVDKTELADLSMAPQDSWAFVQYYGDSDVQGSEANFRLTVEGAMIARKARIL